MKGKLYQVLPWFTNPERSEPKHVWEGTCPICGRFQDSMSVCSECVDDGWDQRIPPLTILDSNRVPASLTH